jgi:hypothetical protein
MPTSRITEVLIKPVIDGVPRWYAGPDDRRTVRRLSEREALDLLEDDIARFGEPSRPSRRERRTKSAR